MKLLLKLVACTLTLFAPLAGADVYYKYQPAAGIQKNTGATYQNTAAVAADITALWTSGVCSSTTVLFGDGHCASVSASPGGSPTQIQFNSAGSFGGSSNFLWDNTNNVLTLNGAGGGVIDSVTSQPLSLIGGNGLTDLTASSLTLLSGGGATGAGGGIAVNAGPGAVTGAGGSVQINGGNAAGSNQNGGGVSIAGGTLTGSGSGGLVQLITNGTIRETVNYDGGVTLGSPTGGSKGAGTLNMTGCFVNNVACSTGGSGTVTSLTSGTGITLSPGTITTTGSISINTSTVPLLASANIWTNGQTFAPINAAGGPTATAPTWSLEGNTSQGYYQFNNAGSIEGGLCINFTTTCVTGDTTNAVSVVGNGQVDISGNNGTSAQIKISGTAVTTPGAASFGLPASTTINSTTVCLSDGTNCPAGTTLIKSLSGGVSASAIVVGQTALAAKTSSTSRNTVTTTSNDPDLVITSIPAGTYILHGYIEVSCANTTMGMQFNLNTSGTTSTSNNYNGIFGYQGGTVGAAANTPSLALSQTTLLQSLTAASCGVNTNSIGLDGTFTTTGSGTLGFSWAQSVSNASNLQVGQSSFLQITRIN